MRKKVTTITINTDASWHPVHGFGGYAFWIVCDLFKIQKSGAFKTKPKGSSEAEIMCIGNAIATLLAQKELPECVWIVLNTDSLVARTRILKGQSVEGKAVHKLWHKLIKVTGSTRNQIRHVKGHSGKQDARSIVNDWCDREAKKWMRDQVKYANIKPLVLARFND